MTNFKRHRTLLGSADESRRAQEYNSDQRRPSWESEPMPPEEGQVWDPQIFMDEDPG